MLPLMGTITIAILVSIASIFILTLHILHIRKLKDISRDLLCIHAVIVNFVMLSSVCSIVVLLRYFKLDTSEQYSTAYLILAITWIPAGIGFLAMILPWVKRVRNEREKKGGRQN